MDEKRDYCTWFPDTWFGVYIGDCCKKHDGNCGTNSFYKCLCKKVDIVSAFCITVGGGVGCWFKYTSKMFKRL